MANTVQTTVNWAQTFMQYIPLTAQTGSEPAISISNMVVNTMLNAPFTWAWNRNVNTSISTVVGQQDYTQSITDFGFLERVSLTISSTIFEIKDIYNTKALGVSSAQQRPLAISVNSNNGSGTIGFRFMGVPDQIYTVTLTYQKAPVAFTAASQGWQAQAGIPDYFSDIYNNLFLAEAFAAADDPRSQVYRLRGVAALLSKAEGLTEMQVNAFLAQYQARDAQAVANQMKVQQGAQARGQ